MKGLVKFGIAAIALIATLLFFAVIKDAARATILKFTIEDLTTRHGNKNLMLGSSSIEKLDPDKYLTCGTWLNRGIGNSTIADLENYLKISPLSINPLNILLYAGENDVSFGMTAAQTTKEYIELVNKLVDKYPNSDIHIIAIKPSPKRKERWSEFLSVNENLKQYLKDFENGYFHSYPDQGFGSSSFADDGIHLTEEGYNTFTSGINKTCKIN